GFDILLAAGLLSDSRTGHRPRNDWNADSAWRSDRKTQGKPARVCPELPQFGAGMSFALRRLASNTNNPETSHAPTPSGACS
ncbi:hypothetical protein ABTL08_19725, partial [Acinetobacter baumannii]